jgi:GLPGLI family protein
MKYFFLLCFLYFGELKAQNTYSINYSRIAYGENQQIFKGKARLVYNDSISFFYFATPGEEDKLDKLTVLGDKLIHHGIMFDKNKNETLDEVTFPRGNYFVIVDAPKQYNWIFNKQTKNILGYTCSLAYSVKGNDTTMTWYAPELAN